MMRGLVTVLAVGGLLAQQGTQSPYIVYGPAGAAGAYSCGVWTQANLTKPLTTDSADALSWWVLGYVSGAGMVLGTRDKVALARTDSAGIDAWVTKYCAAHPLEDLPTAANTLVWELLAKAVKDPNSVGRRP
jgi:hypothetical protein